MNEQLFENMLAEQQIDLTAEQLAQFNLYYEELISWNEKINLTAITNKDEVYLKHFYDSISPSFYMNFHSIESLCDVGAGAGFPSLPLKVCFPHLKVTIVDSLQKRINFLQQLVEKLNLTNIELVHSRAEDIGRDKQYREQFDLVTARAVAKMSVLAEYCLPLSKNKGKFLALKGANANNELTEAKNAIRKLGGKLVRNELFTLPIEKSERSIVIIEKIKDTPMKFPRKAGVPAKNPLR